MSYYEPTQADEILMEYSQKMKEVLLSSVKEDIEILKRTNEALKAENKALKDDKDRVQSLERSVKYEKDNLMRTVRRERLGELLKDFQIVMYKAYNEGKKAPKCNKCNDDRKIVFNSPTGNVMKENCTCSNNLKHYVVQPYECSEFSLDRDKNKLRAFYKKKVERDYDYYCSENSNLAENIYDGVTKFKDLKDSYYIYFRSEEECQKYCDWLNKKK